MTPRLKASCPHGKWDQHPVFAEPPISYKGLGRTELVPSGMCPGGQLVPADALVVERVEGKWPEWALLGLRSGLFKGPPASQEHVGKRWGYMLDALASAQDGGEPPKDPWDYDP